jgi:type IV pilus assembly protein PilY1
MTYSFPSEIAAIDSTNSGYTDRLYAADTGGRIWRFDVGFTAPTSWTGRMIFSANPGSPNGTVNNSDKGRKIFYKPSVTSEVGYTMLFFGTGDREHPLNTNVVDRLYALKDRNQTLAKNEGDMMDVTNDLLQTTTVTGNVANSNSITDILTRLNATTNYGWFIRLRDPDTDNALGEKVLSQPMIFNKAAFFTTYTPNTVGGDLCTAGNLGVARQYAVNYKTGEAILNYFTGNDTGTALNDRAKSPGGGYLGRKDRAKTTGDGIPSGVVILITAGGQTKMLTGVGGAIASDNPPKGGSLIPLYWRQK